MTNKPCWCHVVTSAFHIVTEYERQGATGHDKQVSRHLLQMLLELIDPFLATEWPKDYIRQSVHWYVC